ncbi:MAG: hypothetical protein COA78_32565 [Blastopirellula sp.]|nr:MAG: hypothetical protein COA78_32565 [Blastopirellula sp.]
MVPSGVKRSDRSGATLVETACILPIFFLFVFTIIEFGHASMVSNVLDNATRTAARWGSANGATSAEVEQYVRDRMQGALDTRLVTIQIKNAGSFDEQNGVLPESQDDFAAMPDIELADADSRQLFMVRATINYSDVALLPNRFLAGITLGGQSFTRHE